MVRGNWQKRVETAQARKDATKQRKQRRNEKENARNQAMNFLTDLDKVIDLTAMISNGYIIHIWTDTIPKNVNISRYIIEENPTSNSYSSPNAKTHWRSNNSGKKSHPRTRSTSITSPDEKQNNTEDANSTKLYCRNHFFYGNCNGMIGKKGKGIKKSCRFVHYQQDPCITLVETIQNSLIHSTNDQDDKIPDFLSSSANAIIAFNASTVDYDASHHTSRDHVGMPMVYHFSISFQDKNILNLFDEQSSDHPPTTVSEVITATLSQQKCSLHNISYIVLDGNLLYDKYQSGSLHSFDVLQTLIMDSNMPLSRSRSNSVSAHLDQFETPNKKIPFSPFQSPPNINMETESMMVKLPAIILEHILLCLPDKYTGYLSQVCKHWYREIGTTSPYLWKHLLLRKKWPLPIMNSLSSSEKTNTIPDLFRQTYLSHYQITRDIKAVQSCIRQFHSYQDKKISLKSFMAAYQNFKSTRDAPDYPNACITIKSFDDTRILAAYPLDGTLRLFEASATANTQTISSPTNQIHSNAKLSCRQLVCIKAVPKNMKKNQFRLIHMDLDDSYITCLSEMYVVNHNHRFMDEDEINAAGNNDRFFPRMISRIEPLLTIISREDLLCAAGGLDSQLENDDALMVLNIKEVVLKFLKDMESNFVGNLSDDTSSILSLDRDDMEVKVTGDVIACRNGYVCFEVSICTYVEDNIDFQTLVDRKICLLSKSKQAIVWMHDVSTHFLPSHSLILASSTASNWNSNGTQRTRQPTHIAIASNLTPHIYVFQIKRHGVSTEAQLVKHSDLCWLDMTSEGWRIVSNGKRKLVVLSSNLVVTGDTYQSANNDSFSSILSFYPFDCDEQDDTPSFLTLKGNCRIISVEPIGKKYIIVLCHCKYDNVLEYSGQWFEPTQEESDVIEARIIHVPSCTEIENIHLTTHDIWMNMIDSENGIPFIFSGSYSHLAMGVSWYGMIMTGSSVRDVLVNAAKKLAIVEEEKKSGKKKQHRSKLGQHRNKHMKKDGFARGMRIM